MILRFIGALLFLCMTLPALGESIRLDAQSNIKDKSLPASKHCPTKKPAISKAQAITIAKAEVLKRMGKKEAEGYTDYVVVLSSRKYYPDAYWSVMSSPDTRIIDAHISIKMNKCGKVLVFKEGL